MAGRNSGRVPTIRTTAAIAHVAKLANVPAEELSGLTIRLDLSKMSKAELRSAAEEEGFTVPSDATKRDMIALLE